MWTPGIVPEKPPHEPLVELLDIVSEKISVGHDEGLGERAVEPLDFALHLWGAGIGMEMDDALLVQERMEVVRKLAPVVGLHMGQRNGGNIFECCHEIGGSFRGMRGVRIGESELAFAVDAGQDISLDAVGESDDGVRFRQLPSMPLAAQFLHCFAGFSLHEAACFAIENIPDRIRELALLLEVGKHSADRGWGMVGNAVLFQEDGYLVFADLLESTLLDDEVFHRIGDDAFAPADRGCAFWIQSLKLSASFFEILLPAEERGTGSLEGFPCCHIPMLLPKCQNAHTLLCLLGDHIPIA